MEDDFGYFGSGLEGYVHYMEACDQALNDIVPEDISGNNNFETGLEGDFWSGEDSEEELFDDLDEEDEDGYLNSDNDDDF